MFKSLRRLFLSGLVVLLPSIVTLYVLYFTFNIIDSFIGSLLKLWLGHAVPGLGFLVTLLVILAAGLVATNVLGKKLLSLVDNAFLQLPVIKPIYAASKQMIDAFTAKRSQLFQSVVLVEYPRRGIYAVGFLTGKGSAEIREKIKKEVVPVFIPTTPNPTSGFLLLVPGDELIHLEMPVEEALKMIISGGVITPPWPGEEEAEK